MSFELPKIRGKVADAVLIEVTTLQTEVMLLQREIEKRQKRLGELSDEVRKILNIPAEPIRINDLPRPPAGTPKPLRTGRK